MKLHISNIFFSLIFFFIFISKIQCSKILFLYFHNSKSHLGSLLPYIKTFANAGHNVTVVHSGETKPKVSGNNINFVFWELGDEDERILNKLLWKFSFNSLDLVRFFYQMEFALDKIMLDYSKENQIVINTKWDLVVVDPLFSSYGFAISSFLKKKYKIPYVIASTTFVMNYQRWSLNLGGSWVSTINMITKEPLDSSDKYNPKKFYDRFINIYDNVLNIIGMHFLLPTFAHKGIRKYGIKNFNLMNFDLKGSAIISDEIIGFGNDVPRTNRIFISGHHCPSGSTLPQNLLEFVEDPSSKGTIYVAFGTLVTFESAPKNVLQAFIDAFNELKSFRIIFVLRKLNFTQFKIEEHVRVLNWAPQLDLLSHPKTKLFMSHGGLKSLKEAICSECPLTVMPMFAEQARNSKTILSLKFGNVINKFTVTKEKIVKALLEILENDEYKKRVKKYKEMYLNLSPIPMIQHATYIAERVIKTKGNNLRFDYVGEKISSFQLYYIEIISIILFFILIISFK